jgi:hypothetical protein
VFSDLFAFRLKFKAIESILTIDRFEKKSRLPLKVQMADRVPAS